MTRKVLVYRADLLPYSETFIKDQVKSYSNWRPVLVGMRRIGGLSLKDIDVRVLDKKTDSMWGRAAKRIRQELSIPPSNVLEQLQQESASLLHIHFGTDAVGIWPVAARLDIPVVVTLHGYDINIHREHWEKGWGFWRKYPQLLVKMAKRPCVHFVAVSSAIRRRAIEFGLPAAAISVCNIGIDVGRFGGPIHPIRERARRVLFVGRLVEKKGCRVLLEAFAQVRQKIPDAELVVVGDGPLRGLLVNRAAELKVPVTFCGSLSSDEVKNQLDLARVFCLPSVTAKNGDAEGFGIVLLEAQASGVPVVSSAKGGAQEGLIQGVTGFAFDEGNVSALNECLTKLLLDDDLATSMSDAASKFVAESFDLHKCTKKLETLYDSLI